MADIISSGPPELKGPDPVGFSIDDLLNIDLDDILTQPSIDQLLQGGMAFTDHEQYRLRAEQLVAATDPLSPYRKVAREAAEQLTAREQAAAARQRALDEQNRLAREKQRAAQAERYRQQQLARQQAAQAEWYRQQQIARQRAAQAEWYRQQQLANQRQVIYQQLIQSLNQASGYFGGRTPSGGPPTDGSIMGPNYHHYWNY